MEAVAFECSPGGETVNVGRGDKENRVKVKSKWMTGPIAEDGMLHLTWTEHGGPSLAVTPDRRGFGSRVIEATIKTQLGGKLERQWPQHGLVCQVWLPLTRLMDKDSNAGGGHSAAA